MTGEREWFGIRCRSSRSGQSWIMLRGHKVGPFETLAEAEKSAKKKTRLATTNAPDLSFSAERVDVNPWGQPVARPTAPKGGSDAR